MTEQPKDGGAAFDLAQMIADREAGTPGPWVYEYTCIGHTVRQPGEMNCGFGANHAGKPEPDARRIARVPAMEAEIIRLTARVERLEGALGAIVDLTTIPGSEFEAKHPELNTMLDGECLQNWHEVVAQFAHNKLNNARAALSTPTEEPK